VFFLPFVFCAPPSAYFMHLEVVFVLLLIKSLLSIKKKNKMRGI
jgi:hypothetical protein